ncbi:MAG: hypothetical protein E2O78_09485 [Caldithrix sp.]|nr:MAG: hypothetical protein E2O78_09485 [Caldithrix sp.]
MTFNGRVFPQVMTLILASRWPSAYHLHPNQPIRFRRYLPAARNACSALRRGVNFLQMTPYLISKLYLPV